MWLLWLVIIGVVITLLCFMPVGVIAAYGDFGVKVALKTAFLRFTIYPRKHKKRVKTKRKEDQAPKKPAGGGNWTRFWPIARTLIAFLNSLRLRISVNEFTLKITLAGDDPCDLGTNYGRTWASVSALQPHLDRLFQIKKQQIDINCDYCADKTKVFCKIDARMPFIRLATLVARYGLRIYKQYSELKNHNKGGTDYEPETPSNA